MNDFVLGPNQTKWLEELENGSRQQVTGHLRKGDSYCCLGVAAELFKTVDVEVRFYEGITEKGFYSYNGGTTNAPEYVQKALKLFDDIGSPTVGSPLTELNDSGTTFKQIAALVRLHPHHYFKESA